MFLTTVKKKFIGELSVGGIVLTAVVALAYRFFMPEWYFAWFPLIPVFFYLFALLVHVLEPVVVCYLCRRHIWLPDIHLPYLSVSYFYRVCFFPYLFLLSFPVFL